MSARALGFSLALALTAACRRDAPPAPPAAPVEPRRETSAQTPADLPTDPTPPGAIGEVVGKPITEDAVREALRRARPGTEVRQAALLAAGRRIAADEAVRAGVAPKAAETADDHVDRFLAATFSATTSCHEIDDAAIAEAWRKQRRRFVHPDVFKVVDVQLVCCPKGRAPCRDEEAAGCFERGAAAMEQARRALGAAKTADELRAAAVSVVASVPGVGVHDYTFAYDYARPHADQGGSWVVMDPAIVGVVRGAQSGTLTEPVRSEYGYHILWVDEHRLPSNRGPDDPSARAEIFDALCKGILERARENYLLDLARNTRPTFDVQALDRIAAGIVDQ